MKTKDYTIFKKINGNFTAVAHKFDLKVRELRKAYDEAKASNPVEFDGVKWDTSLKKSTDAHFVVRDTGVIGSAVT